MKPKLIIVEAPQGGGKTTVTNLLRDKIPYTNLLRLSGIEDKSLSGESKVYEIRRAELRMIQSGIGSGINYILDRSHLSEKVYCNLKYKEYDFHIYISILNDFLNHLTNYYDVFVVVLTATPETYIERLKRDKPEYAGIEFNVENSMKQQEEYLKELRNIEDYHLNINTLVINTVDRSPEEIADNIIKEVF